MKIFGKPVILTTEQLDQEDRRFDLFLPDRQEYDITQTILVQQTDRKYRIVDGFEILTAGLPADRQVPVVVFPPNAQVLDILQTLVLIKQNRRPLLPVEICRIFQFAGSQNSSDAEIIETLYPALGFRKDPKIIKQYRDLASIGAPLDQFLIAKKAPLKIWQLVAKQYRKVRHYLEMLIPLRPTLSLFEELIIHLYEISQRDSLSPEKLFAQLRWQALLQAENQTPQERLQKIRVAVFQRRYPVLSAHREKVRARLEKISLPDNATLLCDDTFEKKEIRLVWSLSSPQDLVKMQEFYFAETIQKLRKLLDTI
ncbi:MAG: hypothetical protein ACP5FZ_09455 [Fidelibacterota bacterium]